MSCTIEVLETNRYELVFQVAENHRLNIRFSLNTKTAVKDLFSGFVLKS
jgi:hypothetical protein